MGKTELRTLGVVHLKKSKLFQAGRAKLQYIMAGKLSYLSKGKNHWFVWRQMTPYQGNAFLFHSPKQLLFELTRRSSTGLNLALHALIPKIQRNDTVRHLGPKSPSRITDAGIDCLSMLALKYTCFHCSKSWRLPHGHHLSTLIPWCKGNVPNKKNHLGAQTA